MHHSKKILAALALFGCGVSHAAMADTVFGFNSGPAHDWRGAYAGAHGGYGMGNDNDVETTGQAPVNVTNVAGGARPARASVEPDGFVGGVQAGYNWQFDHVVLGLEADLAYADMDDSANISTSPLAGGGSLNNRFEQELDYLGTVRARAGYAINNTLLYATGGFAYGGVDNKATFFGPAGNVQFRGSNDDTEFGYAVGGGLEHAIDQRWSLTAGYMFYDLGDDTVNVAVVPGSGGGGTGYNSKFENQGHIFKLGLNYKF